MELGVYIAVGTLFVTIIAHAVRVTWKMRDIEKEVREDFDAHVENLQRDVVRIEREIMARADGIRHETGETGAAIRQKIHDVEVYSRDTFVRKDNFEQAIQRLESAMDRAADRLEDKLDKAIDRLRTAK